MTSADFFPALPSGPSSLDETGLPKRIVAIADIHGMADHFDHLIDRLSEIPDLDDCAFYILGDMVDRGPDSRGVIDRVIDLCDRRQGSRAFIGNHDMWFLQFLKDEMEPEDVHAWLSQGGAETLQSYGVTEQGTVEEARRRVFEVSPEHCGMLTTTENIALVDEFAFVHAGVDPHRSLDRQARYDCAWIRAPFMRHQGMLSHVVVHGHTPQKDKRPTITENRISIDTGAVYGGLLTAAIIDRENRTLDFVSTDGRQMRSNSPRRMDRGFGTAVADYSSGRFAACV
ncbi:metallophosphoesterase [Fulvimarina sp. MAC3]|uniref:metallophosphoesterase n=1 Tax=Fulvimarina sp. MAC3 TaxID=3148887 RepID=UPI0031FCD2B4